MKPPQADGFGTTALYLFLDPGITMDDQKYNERLQDKLEIHMHIHGCSKFTQVGAPCYKA